LSFPYTFTLVLDIVTFPCLQVSDVKKPALPYKLAVTLETFPFNNVWIPIVPNVGPPTGSDPPLAPLPASVYPSEPSPKYPLIWKVKLLIFGLLLYKIFVGRWAVSTSVVKLLFLSKAPVFKADPTWVPTFPAFISSGFTPE